METMIPETDGECKFVTGEDWRKIRGYMKTGRTGRCDECKYNRMDRKPWYRHPKHYEIKRLLGLYPDEHLPYCNLFGKYLHEMCSSDSNYDFIRQVWHVGCDYFYPRDKRFRN